MAFWPVWPLIETCLCFDKKGFVHFLSLSPSLSRSLALQFTEKVKDFKDKKVKDFKDKKVWF